MKKIHNKLRVAVLCVQGAFIEHENILRSIGVEVIELRQKSDMRQKFDALVLPGGESTVQGKLLRELGMFDAIKCKIEAGMPVLATCAGTILLAEDIEDDNRCWLGTLPVTVKRNAYGRQLGSFSMEDEVSDIDGEKFPMKFIRAPYITQVSDGVDILATDKDNHIVGVRYKNQFAYAFHPELTNDTRIHELFINSFLFGDNKYYF